MKTNDVLHDISNIINDNDKYLNNTYLKEVIVKCYNIVREDPSTVEDLYEITSLLIDYLFLILDNDSVIYNRVLSIIAFKYDIILQKELNEKYIDLYLRDVVKIIDKKTYTYNNDQAIAKIAECLAKIQYAYLLINKKDKGVDKIYYSFMEDVADNHLIEQIIKDFNVHPWPDGYSTSMLFLYYMLFKDIPQSKYKNCYDIYYVIITFWKIFKVEHYKMTKEELEKEGYESYNFVYK